MYSSLIGKKPFDGRSWSLRISSVTVHAVVQFNKPHLCNFLWIPGVYVVVTTQHVLDVWFIEVAWQVVDDEAVNVSVFVEHQCHRYLRHQIFLVEHFLLEGVSYQHKLPDRLKLPVCQESFFVDFSAFKLPPAEYRRIMTCPVFHVPFARYKCSQFVI